MFINKLAELPVFRFFIKNKSVGVLILKALLLFPVIPWAWLFLFGAINDARPLPTGFLLFILVFFVVLAVVGLTLIVFAIIWKAKPAKKTNPAKKEKHTKKSTIEETEALSEAVETAEAVVIAQPSYNEYTETNAENELNNENKENEENSQEYKVDYEN